MAKLTPEEILKLSEPIEKVYSDTVDALLINMAKHFNAGYSLSTQEWETASWPSWAAQPRKLRDHLPP